jgi:cell division protein FtsL
MWSVFDVFVVICISAISSILISIVHNWSTARLLYSLQCDVADLQDKILVEIKKRASLTFRERKKDDEMLERIVEEAKNASPAREPLPWWAKLTQEDKKVS